MRDCSALANRRSGISVSSGQASVIVNPAVRRASTRVAHPSVVLCA